MTEIAAAERPAAVAPSAHRTRPRRPWTLHWRGLASAGLLAGCAVLAGPSQARPAAVEFLPLSGGVFSLNVAGSEATAKERTEQLHAHGLTNVSVRTVAVMPQAVGFWAGVSSDGDVPVWVNESISEQMAGYQSTVELPARFDGRVTFFVGRAAKAGETAASEALINALAPGGVLHCLRLSGEDAEVAAARVSRAGYIPHWITGILRPGGPTLQRVPVEPEPGSRVNYATVPNGSYSIWPADSRDVYLRTALPDSPGYQPRLWWGYPMSQRTGGTPDYSDCPALR